MFNDSASPLNPLNGGIIKLLATVFVLALLVKDPLRRLVKCV